MSNSHATETENKTHVADSGMSAMVGEEEYLSASSSGDIAKLTSGDSPPLNPQNVLSLQRQLGNQATLNIINRQTADSSSGDANPFAGLKMVTPGTVQREDEDEGGVITRSNAMDDMDEDNGGGDDDAKNALDAEDPDNQDDEAEFGKIEKQSSEVIEIIDKTNTTDDVPSDYDYREDDDDEYSVLAVVSPVADPTDTDDSNNDAADQDQQDDKPSKKQSKWTGKGGSPNPKDTVGNQKLKIKGKDRVAFGVGTDTSVTKEGTKNVTKDAAIFAGAVTAGQKIKEGLGQGATASDLGAEVAVGGFQAFLNVMKIIGGQFLLPIGLLAQRIYGVVLKRKHMKAYKAMADDAGADKKDFADSKKKDVYAPKDDALLGAYAYNKTRRGFWLRAAQAGALAGQLIARAITFFTGGAAAIVSEAVDISLGLANAASKLGSSLKGLFKMIRLTRGKRRAEASNQLIDNAIRGEVRSLQAMIDAEVLSKSFMTQRKSANLMLSTPDKQKASDYKLLATRPKTPEDMQKYLHAAQRQKLIKTIKLQAAETMKST